MLGLGTAPGSAGVMAAAMTPPPLVHRHDVHQSAEAVVSAVRDVAFSMGIAPSGTVVAGASVRDLLLHERNMEETARNLVFIRSMTEQTDVHLDNCLAAGPTLDRLSHGMDATFQVLADLLYHAPSTSVPYSSSASSSAASCASTLSSSSSSSSSLTSSLPSSARTAPPHGS